MGGSDEVGRKRQGQSDLFHVLVCREWENSSESLGLRCQQKYSLFNSIKHYNVFEDLYLFAFIS